MSEITILLNAAQSGDHSAHARLYTLLYRELHQMARTRLRQEQNAALGATSLVHETYLRLLNSGQIIINDRPHFFAYAARVMRSIIVDLVRQRQAERRGGDATHVVLDSALLESVGAPENQILQVSEALDALAKVDERLVQIVEMRYFAGFSEQEIAAALGITDRTVRRGWEKAKLLLAAVLQ